jgi:L-seryl-tRNA(Ser) seleniumtransferase
VNVYEALGLQPIINASGPVTRLGGAPMPPAVLEAYTEAAGWCVPLDQLQAAASRFIAAATGSEAGLVTSGAAAALTLGAAAILTGYNAARMEQLPSCAGFPHEFVIARDQRNGYDHAVRATGARLVEVGFNEIGANSGVRRTEGWEYEAAFGPDTAGVLYVHGPNARPSLDEVVERAHRRGLPVLVDAAGELPPRRNLRSIIASGADLVAFSGGKALRGPQATGLLCGRRDLIGAAAVQMLDLDDHPELWDPPPDLIDAAKLAGLPRHGIGRGFKVSKEEIVALLAALRLFAAGEYAEMTADYRSRLERIAAALTDVHATCTLQDREDGECFPLLEITVAERALRRSAMEVCRRLRRGRPPVYVGHGRLHQGKLIVHPMHLDDDAVNHLIRRLREELSRDVIHVSPQAADNLVEAGKTPRISRIEDRG